MLIPWLQGLLSWEKAPMTWVLIHVNILIFAMTLDYLPNKDEKYFSVGDNLALTGRLYQQHVKKFKLNKIDEKMKDIADRNELIKDIADRNVLMMLGGQAIRNPEFIHNYSKNDFTGDQVQIQNWLQAMDKYLKSIHRRPTFVFGLHHDDLSWHSWKTWITYQFMHASFFHLLGNMGILLIFGAALEGLVGGISLLELYVLSGLFGALGFVLLSGSTAAPMVGASGSLSGIMAFYVFREWRKNISFFYFLSPIKDYYGFIYLPTWSLLPLSFLPDLNAYLNTPEELGSGIAYTAHLGGAFFGIFLGVVYLLYTFKMKPYQKT